MQDILDTTGAGAYGGPVAFYGDKLMSDMIFMLQLAGAAPQDFSQVFPSMLCRVADQGVRVIIAVVDSNGDPVNLHGATKKMIKLQKPDGTAVDVAGSFLTNGFDGKIYFTSSVSVPPFSPDGVWFVQAEVVVGGVQQSTRWGCFTVQPNIDAN